MRVFALIVGLTFVYCPVLLASKAEKGSGMTVQDLARDAFLARKERRYEEAVSLYLRAYRIEAVPGLLYNIAYIYERDIEDLDLASRFYRRCIAAEGIDADVLRRAQQRLRDLKRRISRVESRQKVLSLIHI